MHLGSSKAGFTLTHGGRSIDELKGDDFVAQGLGDEDEDLEDDFGINRTVEGEEGAVERDLTRRNNFGGFGDDAGDDDVCRRFPELALNLVTDPESCFQPDRKRTKNEIMSEVIAKSKSYKVNLYCLARDCAPFC
jgi:nucleolar protein 14